MKINYGILAVKMTSQKMEIVHFVGYSKKPTSFDFDDLRRELSDDPEFGLTDQMDEIDLIESPPEIVEYFRDAINEADLQ